MNRGSLVLALTLLALGGCASIPQGVEPDSRDRFERFNRGVYKFNDALDRVVARPAAVAYATVTPRPVRTGVTNFFANLGTPVTMVNELLQWKLVGFGTDTARLVINSTLGIGGLFDPATKMGLQKGDEDLGQTFGRWGVPAGPYLMLPVIGPSTARDIFGRVGDQFAEPRNYVSNGTLRFALTGLELVDKRAGLLEADQVLRRSYDPYGFIRNAYLQRRQFQVYDGNPPDEEPEDFSDDGAAESN
jgi:phospholipid-binding lipoprotein MlaA